ncbi:MAG: histidine phosphatase family protein [Chloroflexi bacterium]|nr:histidine phosphatase family protein [Chloroflexota bacterium]
MRAELVIVRHCQSTWNLEGRCQGDIVEPELTPLGRRQAMRSARKLRKFQFDHIYTSDQLRSYETGRIIAASMGKRTVLTDSRLREMFQGEWQGMLYKDIKARYAQRYTDFQTDPLKADPPGGETIRDLAQRVSDALNDISERHPGERVLIVSHEIPIATMRCLVMGRPLSDVFAYGPANGEWMQLPWPPVHPAAAFAARQNVRVYKLSLSPS